MNPLASGAFFKLEATVKCLDRVCVVSPFMGIGGRTGLGLSPGAWPKAVLASTSNPDKTTKAIAGNRDLFFLFIEDFFYSDCLFEREYNITVIFLANNRQNRTSRDRVMKSSSNILCHFTLHLINLD